MALKKKTFGYILVILLALAALIRFFPYSMLNDIQKSGRLNLPGLTAPVEVLRDDSKMAYIHAKNLDDALLAQGFVTAQDRLFQMNLTRLFASGRICELAGEIGKKIDIRMRTIGFRRNAEKHAKILNTETRHFLQQYADGVNAYITTRKKTRHLAFKLAGIQPDPWTVEDTLTILYYMGWDSAGNIGAEIVSQMLIDKLGIEKAREIFPLMKNPDEATVAVATAGMQPKVPGLQTAADPLLAGYLERGRLAVGSNNWAIDDRHSQSGKPIVANDPHLDSHLLPGPWYPCGIILPDMRAVGVMIPGIPGMVVGRTDHIAIGVTNAYGDAQDLFIETVDPKDPNRYLEGDKSFPFATKEETLKIKDKNAPGGVREEKITIRFTHRGPVVSSVLPGLRTKKVMTLRWAPFENMWPSLGIEKILYARSVTDVREALRWINVIMLNFVFADTQGNIGWHVSSRLPIRSQGDGSLPHVVTDEHEHWTGFVPFDENPHRYNPLRGWVGTCNHYTVDHNYPYYYSSQVSTRYRYERLMQLLDSGDKKTADDSWRYQQDTVNLLAQKVAPLMATALMNTAETQKLGKLLSAWNFHDDTDKAGALVYHAVFIEFAKLVYSDELGEDLAKTMLDQWTYWQERMEQMILQGDSPWFDNIKTADIKETRDTLFQQAGLKALERLEARFGSDPQKWTWGEAHRIEFVSPIRTEGFGKGLLGGGSHPFPGSVDTLCRGMFDFNAPFNVTVSASLRMVADLGNPDKILAVLPGGVSGRLFDPHTTDQIIPFVKGQKHYWWFSDSAIQAHAKSTLTLTP